MSFKDLNPEKIITDKRPRKGKREGTKKVLRTAAAKNRKVKTIPLCTWRYYAMIVVVGVLFSGLLGRAAYLQVLHSENLVQAGDQRSVRIEGVASSRGVIVDRNGRELARSVPVDSVWMDPSIVVKQPQIFDSNDWKKLAASLNMTDDELTAWTMKRSTRRDVWLKRHLDPNIAQFIERLDIPGVNMRAEYRRYYPTAEVSAHLVGFTGIDDKGLEGIERAYNEWLSGAPGTEKVVLDLYRRPVSKRQSLTDAQHGNDLQLSVDSRLQAVAYKELKTAVLKHRAKGGAAVVVDVKTGEVLAMASQPSFNPNRRADRNPAAARNRAVTDIFEPGSTVKPLTVISALESGNYTTDSIIDTSPGRFRVRGGWVRDPRNYGELDFAGIIRKSSNVGVSRLALAMTDERFLDIFYRVGFGLDSGTGFPGESAGKLVVRNNWSAIEKATFSYGYGFQVTALQLAQAYAVLGNGGMKTPVSLLKIDEPERGERVIRETIARSVVGMMEQVVADGGTGTRAQVDGYRVAGKTGTARKAVAGGYGDQYVSVFAGLAPASDPALAVVIMIDEPQGDRYHGGEVSAPVFSEVMGSSLRLLNVPPDGDNVHSINIATSTTGLNNTVGGRQ